MRNRIKAMQSTPKFMTITEASEFFGVSKYQLRSWIKSGCIAHTFIGNRYIIETESLQGLLYNDVDCYASRSKR